MLVSRGKRWAAGRPVGTLQTEGRSTMMLAGVGGENRHVRLPHTSCWSCLTLCTRKKRAGPVGKQKSNQDTASSVLVASTEPAGAAFFKNFGGLSNHRNAVASFRAGDQLWPTLMQSFLALSALRNFCAAIGRLMEIDSAVSPWYAWIWGVAGRGLALRGGGRKDSARVRASLHARRSSRFRPLSPPSCLVHAR